MNFRKISTHLIKYILITASFFFCLTLPLKAQVSAVDLTVDREKVVTGETFVLNIKITGSPEVSAADVENLNIEHFEVISTSRYTNLSLWGGDLETSTEIQYVLLPVETGIFEIGPVEFPSGNGTVRSKSVTITVEESISPTPAITYPTPSVPNHYNTYSSPQGKELWAVQVVDKNEAYVNEQIILTFKFYYRATFYGSSNYVPPEFTGFRSENLYQSSNPSIENIDGLDYYVEEIKTALFPISSGEKVIGPTVLNVPVDFFDYDTIKSNEVTVNVKPLPDKGKPEHFSGAVGEFTIYLQADKEEVEVNQPVSLEVIVEGWGNVDNIGEPKFPKLEGCKIYTSGTSKENKIDSGFIYGQKKFKYTIIPTRSGNMEIPEITYSYFNPARDKYDIIKTGAYRINVLPGGDNTEQAAVNQQEEIKITGQDIAYIKSDFKSFTQGDPYLYRNPYLRVFIFFPPLAVLISFFYKKYLNRLNGDTGFARLRISYKKARKSLNKAGKFLEEEKEKEFYSVIALLLNEYIGDKCNLPPAGLTLEQINSIFKEKDLKGEISEQFRSCYEACEFARFAPGNTGKEKMKQVFNETVKLLSLLEKKL